MRIPSNVALTAPKQSIIAMIVMLLWCVGLLAYRSYLTQNSFVGNDKSSLGMIWNLFLAVVPLGWSFAFQAANTRQLPILTGIFFFLWLLFLPNAPYLITDVLHLHSSPHVPFWYVLAVLMSCAGAGTILGYLSLVHVQTVIEQKYGRKTGWVVAVCSLMLCSFGIYLGRCLHWNSWDVFTRPMQILATISRQFVHPGLQPHPLAVTFVFGISLLIGYLVLRTFSLAKLELPNSKGKIRVK